MRCDPSLIPIRPNLSFEFELWAAGVGDIAGVDEAGRGALAGPVTAAAVILPKDPELSVHLWGVRDSKSIAEQEREHWAQRIRDLRLAAAVGFATAGEIDQLGILPATRLAMRRAIAGLELQPNHLLLDHLLLPDSPLPQTALTKGDARSLSIAAASILAKVARDLRMSALDREYPGYGFARHKGYGTRAHRDTLIEAGPSAVHRMSFAPMKLLG